MHAQALVLLLFLAASGCSTSPTSGDVETDTTALPAAPVDTRWVTRQSRYTLLELTADMQQQELLLQIIDIRLPSGLPLTVGDALRYVLRHSGFRLSEGSADAQTLYALPLPASHFQLGPVTLREALQTLAGPGWRLCADSLERRLWFVRVVETDKEAAHEAP